MDRREFIKHSTAAVAGSSLLLTACKKRVQSSEYGVQSSENQVVSSENQVVSSENQVVSSEEAMTMRTNPNTGDKVSLLGFGMMRLPEKEQTEGAPFALDQEAVNELVDYALARGVNYFDTAPVYCQGQSEAATGTALARHPRKNYFIATKLSNFSPDTWARKESIAMFERSLQYLQTDYIDYLLLHSIGGTAKGKNSMETFYARYMDNGILDWLVEQKKSRQNTQSRFFLPRRHKNF